jgi:NAD(P)-dependent dehydrogenase (short-subunit alcohol dehydrogenase family)/acyl carrier protein
VVALRGGQRFVRCFEPLPLPAPPARPTRVSGRGTCLVTGGLGGVTTVLAAYLAHTAGARLVLAGRTRMPERSGWADWRRTHGDADPVSQRMLRVESLERLGAEVLLVSADVASEAELREAVRQGEERFGPLRGVIHGAGVVGGETFRPIDQIGPAECEQQFRPKLQGLLALGRVLRGRSLELCVLTSSLSSVLGGYAYAAYAAANVFMDAWAASGDAAGSGPWLSVNWDEWRLSETPPDPGSRGLAQYALGALEGAGAFGRLLELEGASQVVVSTGDLEARLDQWVRLDPQRAAKLLQKDADAPRRHPRPSLQNAYVAPADAVEEAIARIWAELLGIEKVGTQDNFFDLGGHSLLAIQAITAIRTELRAEVSIASLFEGPTVESLASLIRGAGEAKSFDDSSDRGRRRKEERQRRLAERVGGGA